MRFCVLNDQPARREGLKALLRQVDRQAEFSEAVSWQQTQAVLENAYPDLLVVDWNQSMCLSELEMLLEHYPVLQVAVLTDEAGPETAAAMLAAGVLGVVPRSLPATLVIRAFELVLNGGHYVPAEALNLPARPCTANTRSAGFRPLRLPRGESARLSPRQRQIMRFVHLGSTNKIIARTLGISEGTVKIHLASIFQQLGAPNRAAAVALYNGWQLDRLDVLNSETTASAGSRRTEAHPDESSSAQVPNSQQYKNGRATFSRVPSNVKAAAGERFAAETVAHYNPLPTAGPSHVATQHAATGRAALHGSGRSYHQPHPESETEFAAAGLAAALITTAPAYSDSTRTRTRISVETITPRESCTVDGLNLLDGLGDVAEAGDLNELTKELPPSLPLPRDSRPQ